MTEYMSESYQKVIGFFAYASAAEVVCTGKACIILGSEKTMREYLSETEFAGKKYTVRKTRFGEILQGLRMGGAYAFDEESYKVFYPLAKKEGLNVAEADFATKRAEGFRFFTVELLLS